MSNPSSPNVATGPTYARVVWASDEPISLTGADSHLLQKLDRERGPGLVLVAGRWTRFEVLTPGEVCPCARCESEAKAVVTELVPNARTWAGRMILCPVCGNKRCPRATDHHHACTGSNEPGQPGSAYA